MHQRTLDDLVVVGVDCATQPGKVGLARLDVIDGRPTITEACTGAAGTDLAEVVGGWLNARSLIALDAPLGWPKALGERLALHRAGEPLAATADEMFSRATDRKMVEMVGKRPLEVGADRIARTAHAALQFLNTLRSKQEIPVLWDPMELTGGGAIEVYPAATLKGRNLPYGGYKRGEKVADVRHEIVDGLELELALSCRAEAVASDHILDAIVCALAGYDFAKGDAVPPNDLALAQREGWIWVSQRKGARRG
jgi:hypothetical protein